MAQIPAGTAGTWLPIGEAHQAAGVSRRSAYRWANTGKVPTRREHGKLLVTVESLRAEASRPRSATVARGQVAPAKSRKRSGPPVVFDSPDEFWTHLIATNDDRGSQHEADIVGLLKRVAQLERHVFGSSPEGERRAPPTKRLVPGTFKAPKIRNKPSE